MRNYIDILEEIDSKPQNTKFEKFRIEIEIPFRNSISSLEICSEVKSKFQSFELKNEKIINLIGTQIDEFYDYCKFNKI
jgi:hypothetical protein